MREWVQPQKISGIPNGVPPEIREAADEDTSNLTALFTSFLSLLQQRSVLMKIWSDPCTATGKNNATI